MDRSHMKVELLLHSCDPIHLLGSLPMVPKSQSISNYYVIRDMEGAPGE